MGPWVSKFVSGPRVPPLEEELVNRHVRFRPDERLEHLESGLGDVESFGHEDISEAPILSHAANASDEVSDIGRPSPERQSANQDEMGHPATSSFQLTMQPLDIEKMEGRNEEARNGSRPENENQERQLESGRKFASWAAGMSFAGFMAMIGVQVANPPTNSRRKLLFYFCATSVAADFIISMSLLLFTKMRPALWFQPAMIITCSECLIAGVFVLAVGFGLAMIY